jgi:hypothetical protein
MQPGCHSVNFRPMGFASPFFNGFAKQYSVFPTWHGRFAIYYVSECYNKSGVLKRKVE